MDDLQLGRSAGSNISKANWYIKTYFNKLIREKGYKLTVEQWSLLLVIWQNPEKTQTEIAEMGLKDKTNVTRILDLLQKDGNIERCPDPLDRRKYRIKITEKGETAMRALFPLAEKVNSDAAAGISVEKLKILNEMLGTFISNLKVLLE